MLDREPFAATRPSTIRAACIATAFVALAAAGAAAADSYDVTVTIETGEIHRTTTDGPASTGVQADDFAASPYPYGGETSVIEVEGFASAFPGDLAGRSRAYFSMPLGSGAGVTLDDNSAHAHLRVDDLVIHGPSGTVNFRVNVEAIGHVSIRQEGFTTGAWASVSARGKLVPSQGPATYWDFGQMSLCQQGAGALGFGCSAGSSQSTGMFENWTGSGIGTSPELTAPVGEVLQLELELDTGAYVFAYQGGPPDAFAEADSDFAGALRFPSSIPVLTLPAGYSAESATGAITVPEPSAFASVCLAILALLSWRFWRGSSCLIASPRHTDANPTPPRTRREMLLRPNSPRLLGAQLAAGPGPPHGGGLCSGSW